MANLQLIENLRGYRVANELTQEYVSMKLNISRQAYSNYERGIRTPDIDLLVQLAMLYQITLEQLILVPHNNTRTLPKDYSIHCQEDNHGNTLFITEAEMDYIIKRRQCEGTEIITINTTTNGK